MADEFLERNKIYQELLKTPGQFLEHQGNLQQNFLSRINPKFLEIYTATSYDSYSYQLLSEYLEFLDQYGHPDEDWISVILNVDTNQLTVNPVVQEKIRKLKLPFDSDKYLTVLAEYGYLKLLKLHINEEVDEAALRYSAQNGHLEVVKLLTKYFDEHSEALCLSISHGHIEVAKYLMNLGNEVDEDMFWLAIENDEAEMVEYLESLGFEISDREYTFQDAIELGNFSMVQYLYPDVEVTESHLLTALNKGHYDIFQFLSRQSGIIPEESNKIQERFKFAVHNNHLKFARYYLNLGAELEPQLINICCNRDYVDLLKLFLEFGAPITKQIMIIASENLDLLQVILQRQSQYRDIMMRLVFQNRHPDYSNVEYLISLGVSPVGYLMAAVKSGNLRLVKLVSNYRDLQDPLLLDVAISHNNPEVIRYLLDSGINQSRINYEKIYSDPKLIELFNLN